MLTIRPRDFIKVRAAARMKLYVPLRLTSTTRSKSSSLIRRSSWSRVIPALFTRMSRPPSSASTVLPSSLTGPEAATSTPYAAAWPPSAWQAAADSLARSAVVATHATRAPRPARRSAIARPMPREAPVTSATLPASVRSIGGVGSLKGIGGRGESGAGTERPRAPGEARIRPPPGWKCKGGSCREIRGHGRRAADGGLVDLAQDPRQDLARTGLEERAQPRGERPADRPLPKHGRAALRR